MEPTTPSTRLLINLRDGIVDVHGSEEFVRSIYQDFKEQVSKSAMVAKAPLAAPLQIEEVPQDRESKRRKITGRAVSKNDAGKTGEYKPKFNSSLNLQTLDELYDRFAPSNNSEKILLFAIFLRDQLKMTACTADDIYTCFFTLKNRTKTPEAFVQAFWNAQARTHFIEFHSIDKIEVTIAGDKFAI